MCVLLSTESLSSRNSELLAPPTLSGEQNAYIPFVFAKDCIQKVMAYMLLCFFFFIVNHFYFNCYLYFYFIVIK